MSNYFWYVCHLVSLCHRILQVIFPSDTPRTALDWIPRRYCWNMSWIHQNISLYAGLYILFFRYCKYGHQSLWYPECDSFLLGVLHSSWCQSLRVELNHQEIFSVDIPTWYMQSYFHPFHTLRVQMSHKYRPWNVWWNYHHTCYLSFYDGPIYYWMNSILTSIP